MEDTLAESELPVKKRLYYLCNYTSKELDLTVAYAQWSMAYSDALNRGVGWDAISGENALKGTHKWRLIMSDSQKKERVQ